MRETGAEAEYLVGAQPEVNPTSFSQLVREAFLLEHGARRDKDIALVLGVDKSRVSQIFRDVQILEAVSIDGLLAKIDSPMHKRKILRAWTKERFGVDPLGRGGGNRVGEVSEKTIRRIDRQIREHRPEAALRTATDALGKAEDEVLIERLLDRCFLLRQSLDEPGRAMAVARFIARRAERRGETRRFLMAQLFRIRAHLMLADSGPDEVNWLFEMVEDALRVNPPIPNPAPPYVLADAGKLALLRLGASLTFAERGVVTLDMEYLRTNLAAIMLRTTKRHSATTRTNAFQTAARIHLLLGATFNAQEVLEKSLDAGELKRLNTFEMCGLIQGRITAKTEELEKALAYMREVRGLSVSTNDRYHARLAEYDIARLESRLFPTTAKNS